MPLPPLPPSPTRIAFLLQGANPVFTFVGPASFLNSQSEFDAIFPEPIALTLEPGTISATEGYLTTTATVPVLPHYSHVADPYLRLTPTLSLAPANKRCISPLSRTRSDWLGALRFHRRKPGQLHDWTPNTLFDHYVTESNNLPEDCTAWSSPLTSLFYGNLPEDVAIAVTDDPTFSFPSSAQLNSKAQQLAQLSILPTHVNQEWTLLTKQTAVFNRICENRLRSLQRTPGRGPTTPTPLRRRAPAITLPTRSDTTRFFTHRVPPQPRWRCEREARIKPPSTPAISTGGHSSLRRTR